ncbi:MAG: hypothetical protein ACREMY_03155, partial [bacterium]
TWVSDSPGRISPRWKNFEKPRKGKTYPPHGPQYKVGDRLVVYITEKGVCPAILEVASEPRWDPGFVDAESGRGEGREWGVVTVVKGIWSLGLAEAPALEDIGVTKARVQRHGHISLSDSEYEEAEALISKRRRRKGSPKPVTNVQVPIEQGNVEGYDVMPSSTVKRAERREARLVRDYCSYVEMQGDDVARNKLLPHGASHPLYSDIFNNTRGQLIEAKAGLTRGDIRMAIGQLADYGRYVSPGSAHAVLLDAKPKADLLDLLASQGIAAIWRNGDGFDDNAGGKFV